MFALSLVAAAVVTPLVFAQDATLGLQAIKAHFQQSALVPDLFASFEPTALVTLTFSGAFTSFSQLAQHCSHYVLNNRRWRVTAWSTFDQRPYVFSSFVGVLALIDSQRLHLFQR